MTIAASLTRLLPVRSLRSGANPRGPVTSADVDDLVESFSRGAPQLHNVVVRPVPGADKAWEVVAGHRRVEAARRMGWSHVEAKVISVDDATAERLALEENLRRRALPDEVTAVARLVALYEQTSPVKHGGDRRSTTFKKGRPSGHDGRLNAVEQVAVTTGQSPREVRRKAKVGKLGTPKLRAALSEHRIGLVAAEQLAGLDPQEQDRQLREVLRPRRGKPLEVVPELERAADSLDHAARILASFSKSRLPAEVVTRLKEKHRAVGTALERLASSPRPGSTMPVVSHAAPSADAAVKVEPITYNGKLAPISFSPHTRRARPHPVPPFVTATSVSMVATCPAACAFRGSPTSPGGCYVDAGFTKIGLQKLDRAAASFSAEEVIAAETRALDDLFDGGPIPQDGARGGRDLRLHVGGDVGSSEGAKMLARCARRWKARGGGTAWTYTHRWREIPRGAWGDAIIVFASVEQPAEIEQARKRGYPAVIVVADFPADGKAYSLAGTSAKVVPCPAEVRDGVTCGSCRLCLDRDLLKLNTAVAFKVHGQHSRSALLALRRGGDRDGRDAGCQVASSAKNFRTHRKSSSTSS